MSELAGTKELIFDTFVEMTSVVGYENVNVRDIAKKESGILAMLARLLSTALK